jgi:iron complex outermembrane receptor protein
MKTYKLASIALCVATALQTNVATAQETQKKESVLEKITVTAQKRTQSIQDVPISVATLSGEQFESIFSGGEDILALAVRVPGLYAE